MRDAQTLTSVRTTSARTTTRERFSPVVVVRPRNAAYLPVKASFEWTSAFVMMVAAAPLMAGLGLLVKATSEGPVLYSQVRLGRYGRSFRIYKLRTMTHGAERSTGPVWSVGNDPRVTRIGRWLRDTHLDELPQLWNVLRGDMSLIGPRPERPEIASEIERLLPGYRDRLLVRPGITGLAQMRLPPDSDLDTVREKLAHDLRYVERVAPGLDARIVASTVLHFLGWAATAASRRLVKPFVPEAPPAPQIVVPQTELARPARRATDRRTAEQATADQPTSLAAAA